MQILIEISDMMTKQEAMKKFMAANKTKKEAVEALEERMKKEYRNGTSG